MFLLDWYRQYLNIKWESRERKNLVVIDEKVCQSCETLKAQLEIANYEKSQLLNKLLKEPEPEPVAPQPPMITRPRQMSWNVRRQLLEQEDRVKAQRLKSVPKPDSPEVAKESVEDLEKELDLAEQTRESAAATKEG